VSWTREEFEQRLRDKGRAYHIHHPFNVMLNTGTNTYPVTVEVSFDSADAITGTVVGGKVGGLVNNFESILVFSSARPEHLGLVEQIDRDFQALNPAFVLTNRESVQQRLCRMLMSAIAGVYNRRVSHAREVLWRAGHRVTDDNAVRRHRFEISRCVEQSLAFAYT